MKQHFESLLQAACVTLLALCLAGCSSIPSASVQTFSVGVAAARSQTSLAFQAVTDVTSQSIIDYAASQPTLSDTNFLPVLDPQSIAVWDTVFSALQQYGQNLVLLASPDLTKGYQDAVVNLATQIKQVGDNLQNQKLIASGPSLSPSLAAAFTELGDLLLRAKAHHDLKRVLSQSDPTIRLVFVTMAEAIGSSATNNLRGTVRANWEQSKANLTIPFLQGNSIDDRRPVAAQYAGLLAAEATQDLALAALQRSLLALADAHHALAHDRSADLATAVAMVEQEVHNTVDLANRFQQLAQPHNAH